MRRPFLFVLLALAVPVPLPFAAAGPAGAVKSAGFVYETAPYPECHASTLAETPRGLVAAWFGGTREKHPDVGIWFSRRQRGRWSTPVEVANGLQYLQQDGPAHRWPCWNPVLFQQPDGPLHLFYKVGPSPSTWWGMRISSRDGGRSWSEPVRLPEGILGPVKNKPLLLPDGRLLCPTSTEHDGWKVHFEWTADQGRSWTRVGPVGDPEGYEAIQPTLFTLSGGRLLALCRSRQKRRVSATESADGGRTWSPLRGTGLPHPNSGLDGVTLRDGRHLLIYNHTERGRSPLNAALSRDGIRWTPLAVLEEQPGEYSYPAVIQTRDGRVHVTYTWKRQRIRHVELEIPAP